MVLWCELSALMLARSNGALCYILDITEYSRVCRLIALQAWPHIAANYPVTHVSSPITPVNWKSITQTNYKCHNSWGTRSLFWSIIFLMLVVPVMKVWLCADGFHVCSMAAMISQRIDNLCTSRHTQLVSDTSWTLAWVVSGIFS